MPHIKSCNTILGMNSTEVLGSSQLFYNSKIEAIGNNLKLAYSSYKKPHTFPDHKHYFPFFPF